MTQNKPRRLPSMTQKELMLGIFYLVMDLLLLPLLLKGVNQLLPVPLTNIWLNFILFFLNFVFICWIFRSYLRKNLTGSVRQLWRMTLTAGGGFALYWLCGAALYWIFNLYFPDFVNLNDASIAQKSQDNYVLTALGLVLLVPLVEETLFRGLVFGGLHSRSPVAAYILSTAFFSAIHVVGYVGQYQQPLHLLLAFIQYLPAGLILAEAYRRTQSIFTAVAIHTIINTMGVLAQR